jgi:hypothetical protein
MNDAGRESAPTGRFHLAYVTANDQWNFSIDYLNFRNMAAHHPGVPRVDITIAISRARPFSKANRLEIDALVRNAATVPWLTVRAVIWKGNRGRDFSSTEACLRSIAEDAVDDDFVMVRNRSAYGPFVNNWYRAYVDQYQRHANTGLVGNTINLTGPPTMAAGEDGRHVQTYVYLSRWQHLAPLAKNYPGNRCTDNAGAIHDGELGLSRKILAAGLNISCLHWPERAFGPATADDPALPRGDIKAEAGGLPFRYKFPDYRRNRDAMLARTAWVIAARWPLQPRRARPTIPYRQVADYD